jgi:tetratricopeptide (TPR) repeat protein
MLASFELAKAGATAKGDEKSLATINDRVNAYYNRFITEEMEMIDPEEPDYEYVIEACDNALAANPGNARALYHMALIKNKQIEYDAAIDFALKALETETEDIWISAINLELGTAYQNTVEYDKACAAFKNVTEDPFLARAEKRMSNLDGCN